MNQFNFNRQGNGMFPAINGTFALGEASNNMSSPAVYNYAGCDISFMSGESVMINATEMAKPFKKRVNDWVNLPSAKEFITILEATRKCGRLVEAINGVGTWMHEDVALEFARWLSPAFAIWCNDRIKELLRTGVATVSNEDEAIAYAMQVLNRRLEESRAEKERLEMQNQLQTEQLKLAAPKVQYVDNVLQSPNTYTSTQVSKELGFRTANDLHKRLKERGVMFCQSGQWMLTANYCGRGFTRSRTTTFTRSDGSVGTNIITVWTEIGRAFLHSMFEGA